MKRLVEAEGESKVREGGGQLSGYGAIEGGTKREVDKMRRELFNTLKEKLE